MLECGIEERWPARHCARRWQEIENAAGVGTAKVTTTSAGAMQGLSQVSSPIEGPVHFAFMPIR